MECWTAEVVLKRATPALHFFNTPSLRRHARILLPHVMHLADDAFLQRVGELVRMQGIAPIHERADGLVAALVQHAFAGDVGEDVVAVAGDPELAGAGEFAFQAQGIVHAGLAAERHKGKVVAKTHDLDRIVVVVAQAAVLDRVELPLVPLALIRGIAGLVALARA